MSKKKKYISSDIKSKLISALLSVSMISSAFTGYDKFGIYRAWLGRRSRCVNACQCRNCRRLRLN